MCRYRFDTGGKPLNEIAHADICIDSAFRLDRPLMCTPDDVFELADGQWFLHKYGERMPVDGRWVIPKVVNIPQKDSRGVKTVMVNIQQ